MQLQHLQPRKPPLPTPQRAFPQASTDDKPQGGYLWTYSLKEQVVLSGAEEDTGLYHFGRGLLNKTFCRTCGVHMTNQYRPVTPERLANFSDFDKSWIPMAQKNHPVNVRVLHGVDIDELPAPERRTNTKDMEPSYENP